METKEQLTKQHAEWTVRYMMARKRFMSLLSGCNIGKGKETPIWTLTKKSLTEIESVMKDEEQAMHKLHEIMKKCSKLSQ
ncbi:hypothetical protein ACFLTP_00035 [Chloroflexota bacterium]